MLAYFTSFIQQWMHIDRVPNKEVSVCLSGTVLETKLRLHTALSQVGVPDIWGRDWYKQVMYPIREVRGA